MTEFEREPARRVFAEEFQEATHEFKESDDERAPRYSLLPTGEKANRVFFVGTLTYKEDLGGESEFWQGDVVGPTGTVYVTAGQYNPEATSVLREAEPPEYVAVVGKVRRFEPEDSDNVYLSIRANRITFVDSDTKRQWVAETAERTLDRIENEDSEYYDMAQEVYEEYGSDYLEMVLEALEELEDNLEEDET